MRDYYQTAKEEERRRRRRRVRLYIVTLFLIGLCVGGIFFIRSSFFSVHTILVNNSESSLAQKIESSFVNILNNQNSFLEKIFGKNNILVSIFKRESVVKEVMVQNPAVKRFSLNANILKNFIDLRFEEREQFGLWCTPKEGGEICWWFDKEGVLFSQGPQTTGTLINKVTDLSGHPLSLGETVFDDTRYQETLVKIFSFLSQSGTNINHIILKNRALAEVETSHPTYPTIYFSLRVDPFFALQPIRELEKKFDSLEYIDLRVKNRVYYK